MNRWLYLVWINSLIAVAGSLFFSEVLKFPPCTLCWYQRLMMFPLVIILAISFISNDTSVRKYVWPFVIMGLIISLYHNLIYYDFIPQLVTTCASGASCTEKQVNYFGFISIPLLSFSNFAISTFLLLIPNRKDS